MPDSLQWNWMPPGPDWQTPYEAVLGKLEAALADDMGNELLQLRVFESRVATGNLEAAVKLGSSRPPGKPAQGFSSHRWDTALAKALFSLGRFDECLLRIDAVLAAQDEPELRQLRIEALFQSNRQQDAARELDLQRADPAFHLRNSAVELALRHWEPDEVLAYLDRAAATTASPGDFAEARIACLVKLGRTREVSAMVDLDRHVVEVSMNPPPGRDLSSFHKSLLADIGDISDFEHEPHGVATRGGMQSRKSLPAGLKAIAALTRQIQREVERYCEALPASDPIRQSRPERPVIYPWVVVLDQNGYQLPHIHAEGWLSGVYYVAAPDTDLEDGALRIGLPRIGISALPWPIRRILAEPGKLVLFPSFLRHDTTPHRSASPRISIAFDILHK